MRVNLAKSIYVNTKSTYIEYCILNHFTQSFERNYLQDEGIYTVFVFYNECRSYFVQHDILDQKAFKIR